MKKKLKAWLAVCSVFLTFALAGCADADGLHDQNALMVTFEFKGFGENISGNYAIPGNFKGDSGGAWNRLISTVDVVMESGNGISNPIAVTGQKIQFSLIPTNDAAWSRPWHSSSLYGNYAKDWLNFELDGLDLDAGEVTVLVDASAGGEVTPRIK